MVVVVVVMVVVVLLFSLFCCCFSERGSEKSKDTQGGRQGETGEPLENVLILSSSPIA